MEQIRNPYFTAYTRQYNTIRTHHLFENRQNSWFLLDVDGSVTRDHKSVILYDRDHQLTKLPRKETARDRKVGHFKEDLI